MIEHKSSHAHDVQIKDVVMHDFFHLHITLIALQHQMSQFLYVAHYPATLWIIADACIDLCGDLECSIVSLLHCCRGHHCNLCLFLS